MSFEFGFTNIESGMRNGFFDMTFGMKTRNMCLSMAMLY